MKTGIFFFLIFVSLACSKQHQTAKGISGNWKVVSYKQTYTSGLSAFVEAQGMFVFDNYAPKSTSAAAFKRTINYQSGSTTLSFEEEGRYTIEKKGKDFKVILPTIDPTKSDTLHYSIIILTSSDLEIETQHDNVLHTFLLKKE